MTKEEYEKIKNEIDQTMEQTNKSIENCQKMINTRRTNVIDAMNKYVCAMIETMKEVNIHIADVTIGNDLICYYLDSCALSIGYHCGTARCYIYEGFFEHLGDKLNNNYLKDLELFFSKHNVDEVLSAIREQKLKQLKESLESKIKLLDVITEY